MNELVDDLLRHELYLVNKMIEHNEDLISIRKEEIENYENHMRDLMEKKEAIEEGIASNAGV